MPVPQQSFAIRVTRSRNGAFALSPARIPPTGPKSDVPREFEMLEMCFT